MVGWEAGHDREAMGASDSWPTVYILDARGVIRYQSGKPGEKSGFGDEFEKVLAEVLKEAEGTEPPSR